MVRPGLDLGMGDLTLDVSLDLRDEEDGRLKAAADLRGLALESDAFNALGLDKRLLPNDLAVVFSASEMPSQVLGRLFTETFTVSGTIGPDGAEGDTTATSPEGDAAPLSILSGKLLLEDLLLVSPIMRVTATGSGQISEDAALGLSGSISSEISGMEALQALLQEMTQNEDPEIAGMALEALVGIGVVMGFAQGPETPEPETPGALSYLLRLDPDGAFTVNGLPVSQP